MWKAASFAGFQAPRAGRTVVVDVPSFRPRSAISTARPRFIGHSGENVLFGPPRSENRRLPESRVECTFLQILVQSPFIGDPLDASPSLPNSPQLRFIGKGRHGIHVGQRPSYPFWPGEENQNRRLVKSPAEWPSRSSAQRANRSEHRGPRGKGNCASKVSKNCKRKVITQRGHSQSRRFDAESAQNNIHSDVEKSQV
jgi:hypothetical protein